MSDAPGLLACLRAALEGEARALADAPLEMMADKGLAHHHVRLVGTGSIARLPKQSQMGWSALDNLCYQAACFERAGASGHVPQLRGVLAPSVHLPRGGLLVEEVIGRPVRLPEDLHAVVEALAAIHSLPVPDWREPLLAPQRPWAALWSEIAAQALHFEAAGIEPDTRRAIEHLSGQVERAMTRLGEAPVRLISFDAHPGNFLLRPDGRAMLVDLEKARYGPPPLDLAHATLYTSTTWDVDTRAELSVQQVLDACAHWQRCAVGGAAWRPWLAPLRASMWLWSLSWCAKWRVLSRHDAAASADGEDWSAEKSEDALVRHVRERVDCYLSAPVVAAGCEEIAALERAWAH